MYLLKYLKGDIFVNSMTTNAADIPIVMLGGIAYKFLGIRFSLFIAFIAASIGSISLLFFSGSFPGIIPVMLMLAKGGVKMTFNIVYLANSQIFPAIFAGTAFGICNIGGKVATIFSPYMAEVDPPVPMIVFTVLAVVAAFLSLFIKTSAS
jgi:OCT family organic cation transporter-like MFS transporter 3